MLTLSRDDSRKIGANLKRWSERPIAATNLRAAAICVLAFLMMLVAGRDMPDPVDAIRHVAIVFVVVQSAVHVISLAMLRTLIRAGVKEAVAALASYRDPRRLSSLDLAVAWSAVALVARFFE